ncbi:MAG: HAD-IC family P-type ATPase [Methanomassiliicoccales archaeon]|nr:HAD-IC family P-type ATPase [Methanomassiliicoccales archaeon]NYT14768.1 HAD-IC family P-type ATPase [Methanomassiliicoccales archaeon]
MEEGLTWHDRSVEESLDKLGTSRLGLTNKERERRLKEYGPNELEEKDRVRKIDILLAQLKNPLNLVLVVAAVVSYLGGKTIDTIVIAVIIAFNAIMGFVQEYKAERAVESLRSMVSQEVDVIRICDEDTHQECHEIRMKASNLVPGDLILIEAGDKVQADCRLLEAMNLEVDEAFLTGESTTVRKSTEPLDKDTPVAERKNIIFSGSSITQGRGKAVVFATGMRTEIGMIAGLIRESERGEAPIQRRTKDLSIKLGSLAVLASVLTLTIGLLRGFEFFEILAFSLAAAVSAIPEGLLVVMTIALSIGAYRMVRRNALIRRLNAVETLGSVTAICSDKTGTLTTNQMTARRVLADGKEIEITGVGFASEGSFQVNGKMIEVEGNSALITLLRGVVLCNDARLRQHEVEGEIRWEVIGDPTEGALIVAAEKASMHQDEIREDYHRIDEIPFNPAKRFMVTFHQSSDEIISFAKGAPEAILDICSSILLNGQIQDFSDDMKEEVIEKGQDMASSALRVLGVAYRDLDRKDLEDCKDIINEGKGDMIFLGLIGMIDPPRREARESVRLCRTAGIRVIMSTGDHKNTAEAIAKEIGILDPGDEAVTGAELDSLTDDELDIIERTTVFARVSPEHKNRIVNALKAKGHVVAMTGDGVNDAPALKSSNIAIAMGITGTDVTKEVADMILTDDNFASIVNAVEEGRVVFENIRKVVKYLITTNTAEIITILSALILFPDHPLILTPIMILWINLVTDGLLDKTLVLEAKEADIMEQPPRDPREKIIDRLMVRNVIILGVLMTAITLFFFDREIMNGDIQRARTFAFVTMAMFQVFNGLNCRSRDRSAFTLGFRTNKYLFVAMGASVCLLYLATTIPILQVGLGTVELRPIDWATIIASTSTVFILDEIRKLFTRRKGKTEMKAAAAH